MDELIFTRRRHNKACDERQTVIRIGKEQYNKVIEVADETGRSIQDVASRMTDFAFEHIRYEDAEPLERS